MTALNSVHLERENLGEKTQGSSGGGNFLGIDQRFVFEAFLESLEVAELAREEGLNGMGQEKLVVLQPPVGASPSWNEITIPA